MKPYEKIKLIRSEKKISTYELAKLTGIPQSTISKIENGKRKFDIDFIQKISETLNIPINTFFDNNTEYKSIDYSLSIGSNIRNIRKSKGYSIMKIKEITGLSKSTISELENDKTSPTTETLNKLAKALDVPVSSFFNKTTTKNININILKKYTDNYKFKSRDRKQYLAEIKKVNESFFMNDEFNEETKKEILDLMSELFWEAKIMNKIKK